MSFYYLNSGCIIKNINSLLCKYENHDISALFDPDFVPETFTVEDKRKGILLPFFSYLSYEDWIHNLVVSQLQYINKQNDDLAIDAVIINIKLFIDYCKDNNIKIYNQEFVEIIRIITTYTLTGSFSKLIQSATEMNTYTDIIIPKVIQKLRKMYLSDADWFVLSILSGLSGIDMKSGPLATLSLFGSNSGIALYPLMDLPIEAAIDQYIQQLLHLFYNCSKPIFDWDILCSTLIMSKHIVWLADDYLESFFDYVVIEKLLEKYPALKITLIPKDNIYGNDLSYDQALRMLSLSPLLIHYSKNKRFTVLHTGPKMAAANLHKLSEENAKLLATSDAVIIKGCRMHEMLQGGLKIPSFSLFNIIASTTEKLTGYKSNNTPVTLLFLEPGEYAFWGIMPKNNPENPQDICCNTKNHRKNKQSKELSYLKLEYNRLKSLFNNYEGYKRPLIQELCLIKKRLREIGVVDCDHVE